ncbi:ATP-binding protein [Oceanobacillus sojae]|uniref:ATP-binding protein n=1 Tax=Oceanobacillus sojae TaxID=582851 RepID=UPI000988516C|nr:ATP-grasp domain-containing protein [Oceanobacillus sojae]
MNETRFLESLNHPIPEKAHNYMLSTYSIILEAWRRGMEVSVNIQKQPVSGSLAPNYTIKNGENIHHFSVTRGDFVPRKTVKQVINKVSTKKILEENDVPVPKGEEFSADSSNQEIIDYANTINYPVVVKPVAGTGGVGVIAGIENEEELTEALEYVRFKLNSPRIILEKYFKGEDYRVYVLNNEVIGAIKRIRANVIGDGKSTVKQLINLKNRERSMLPSLTNRKIRVDDEVRNILKRKNLDLDSVIPEGEILYIKSKNNVSAGGDSIDITDDLSDNIKEVAIDGANAFNSLAHCGVDIMVDEQNDTGVIIELNSRAHITQHLFPMKGKARDIPSHIIDFYFPETKNYNRENALKFYLDFDFIYDACLNRNAKEVQIPILPTENLQLTRYIISGCKFTDRFATRVRRMAYSNNINGYLKHLDDGNISLIVGSNKKNITTFRKDIETYIKKLNQSSKLRERKRSTPIMHGFHIISSNNSNEETQMKKNMQGYVKLKSDYELAMQQLKKNEIDKNILELAKKQNKYLQRKLDQLESSNSWKITKPIRIITKKLKK